MDNKRENKHIGSVLHDKCSEANQAGRRGGECLCGRWDAGVLGAGAVLAGAAGSSGTSASEAGAQPARWP